MGWIYDLQTATRSLARSPGFTLLAVLVVALGIGASTTIFSILDTLLLRALPYAGAERIVTVWENNPVSGIEKDDVAPGNFFDWRDQAESFEGLAALDPYSYDLTGVERPEVLFAARVTEGFFDIMGTSALHGRTFTDEDYRSGAGQVLMLGHGLWERRFGADPNLVGNALELDGVPYTVVGILPPTFDPHLHPVSSARETWVPLIPQDWERTTRGSRWWNVVARLHEGVGVGQAQAEMDAISARLAADYPDTNRSIRANVVPLREHLVGSSRLGLLVLQGAVLLLLLIACANVAGLFLARGTERAGELSVRAALGADRLHLLRQLLSESLVVALVGGGLGMLGAFLAVDLMGALAPQDLPRINETTVDGRVLLFAALVTAVAAILAGVFPALQLSKPDLQGAMKEGRSSMAGASRRTARSGIVVAEVALSVVLVAGAGLMARSFLSLMSVDPGFDKQGVAVAQMFRYVDGESAQERAVVFDEMVERIRALPGVTDAGITLALPFIESNIGVQTSFAVEGRGVERVGEAPNAFVNVATPGFFSAMGMQSLEGRLVTNEDLATSTPVVVVTQALARRHWPGQSAVGERIRFLDDQGVPDTVVREVVGVVADLQHDGLESEARPEVYLPLSQSPRGGVVVVARTAGSADALTGPIQEAIWGVDVNQTLYRVATLEDLVAKSVAARRFNLWLLMSFAGIALALAAVGIYGVVSYATRLRTQEFGIRMALGADRRLVLREAMGRGVRLAGLGLAIGLVASLGLTSVLRSLLFGVGPRDPLTLVAVVGVLMGVALLATWLPARNATRVDPATALRAE